MSTSELKLVAINDIAVSKTNPRKTFDDKSMEELTESVKLHGILQPILIRPRVPNGTNWVAWKSEHYELVCGERRYRAAVSAGLTEIPANIRTLSDDEAFELQIVENLERKDVHPLEEADAFQRMLESERYTMADIAAKVAKSETFIAQRLKLVDLIPELAMDFRNGHFGIGHAVLFARMNPEDQREHYEAPRNGWNADKDNPDYGTIADIRSQIKDDTYELEDAVFPLDLDNLVPGVPACNACPKRTTCNPVLFADMQESDRCMDSSCFKSKVNAFIERETAKIINEGLDIVFVADYNMKMPEMVKNILKEYKIAPLKQYNDFETHKRTGWDLRKSFNVSEGEYADVYIKPQKSDLTGPVGSTVQNEIQKIKERAERALELDNVKIFKAITDDESIMKRYDKSKLPLTDLETKAMWFLFREVVGYSDQDRYRKLIGHPDGYRDTKEFEFYRDTDVKDLKIETLVRMAIKKMSQMHEPNFETDTRSRFFFEIIKEHYPQKVQEAIEAQGEVSQKRIARTNERLEKLEKEVKAQ